MKIAVPIFQQMIAPRFCYAADFAVYESNDGRQPEWSDNFNLIASDWAGKLERLADNGVGVLLCAGFNRSFLPLAEELGIEIVAGLAGTPEEVVRAFCERRIEEYLICPRSRGFGRCRQSAKNHRNGFSEPERIDMPNRDGTGPAGQGRGAGKGQGGCKAGTARSQGKTTGAGQGQGRGQGRGAGTGGGQGKAGGASRGGNRSPKQD